MSQAVIEIQNAIIFSASIVVERDTWVCPEITFDYGCAQQVYGDRAGSRLDEDIPNAEYEPRAYMDAYIRGILWATKAPSWDELVGLPVRVKTENGLVMGFGHFLEDRWFSFDEADLTANKAMAPKEAGEESGTPPSSPPATPITHL